MEEKLYKISDYMSVNEAADFLGVTANTIRKWEVDRYLVPYINPINNYRLYLKEDLENVLRSIKPIAKK